LLLAFEESVRDDEGCPVFISKGCRKIGLQLRQIFRVDEYAWVALEVLVFLSRVQRQVLRPAKGRRGLPFGVGRVGIHHRPRNAGEHPAVEFRSFQRTVAVLIEPKKQLGRHPTNKQQLLHRLQGFIEGSIGIG
jgi:hypothetical protein